MTDQHLTPSLLHAPGMYGPALPETIMEYPDGVVHCKGNVRSTTVRHAVQLKVFCGGFEGEQGFINIFDCVGVRPKLDYLNDFGLTNGTGTRYACSDTATVPIGSTANQTQTVPGVAISTDMNWPTNRDRLHT